MKRTVDEKLEYNRKLKTDFSAGYVLGVNIYRRYSSANAEGKASIKELIATANENARRGDKLDKGIMCGVRDAANERKSKARK